MSILEWKNGSFERYLLETEKICNLKYLHVIAEVYIHPDASTVYIYGSYH
jgi:hypothetical protein